MAEKCGECGSADHMVPGLDTRRCLACGVNTPYADPEPEPAKKKR